MESSTAVKSAAESIEADTKLQQPTIDPTALVSPQAILRGKVTVGPGTVIGPGCTIEALKREIVVGRENIFEDGAQLTHSQDSVLNIGDGNRFEVGCDVNCPSRIGNFNIVETKATLSPGSSLGDGCFVCAGVTLPPKTRLVIGETVFGQRAERRFDADSVKTFEASLRQNLPVVRNALQSSMASAK